MSVNMKRLLLIILGLSGGFCVWSITEIFLKFQNSFSTYLILSIIMGMFTGVIFGVFFGVSEGVFDNNKIKIFNGITSGSVIGAFGGITGVVTGQALLFLLGTLFISHSSFRTFALPLSRAAGWAMLGIWIGLIEGIRAKSGNKIKVGIIGGFLGGFLGGLFLEYNHLFIPSIIFSRLCGFIIFGFSVGIFYGFIEKQFSFGKLRLLNGPDKGKEFLLTKKNITIGASPMTDINLGAYTNIENSHAEIIIKNKRTLLMPKNKQTLININEDKVTEIDQELKIDDVIQLGSAKFLFKY